MGTLASGSIDLKSLKVAGEGASKYITKVNDSGIKVHSYNDTSGTADTSNYTVIDAEGMEVFQKTNSVAKFGAVTRIGKENDASITIDSTTIAGYGEGGKAFFIFGNSETSISVFTIEYIVSRIDAHEFPSNSNGLTPLSYTLNSTPNNGNIPVHFRVYRAYGTHSAREVSFTYGTSATKTVTVDNSITFTITYDGDKTFSNIKITSSIIATGDTISIAVPYSTTTKAPSYELGGAVSASGGYSYAEGYQTVANGDYSHAEGYHTTAGYGDYSHAEGYYTTASAQSSHAEGGNTTASAFYSHAEGYGTTASNNYAHAEGRSTVASGNQSHAQNLYTKASKNAQTAIGTYNVEDTTPSQAVHPGGTEYGNYALIIGNGTAGNARSNAFTVDWQGNFMGQGMAGVIQMFAGSTAPSGWLFCDGSAISREDYETLFAVIGTTFGAGDGSTTFNLPDFRGRVPVGVGNGTATGHTAHTLGQKAGNENAIVPYHRHNRGGNWTSSTASGDVRAYRSTANSQEGDAYTEYAGTSGNTVGANMQPYLGINYIIATGKTN